MAEPAGNCAEKFRLVRTYVSAISDYNRAVAVLEEFVGVPRKDEYEKMKRFAETSRELAEESRLELEQHTAQHGC